MSNLPELDPVELHRIISIPEAERLSNLSRDVIEKRFRHLIIRLSPRRVGMRLGDALALQYTPCNEAPKKRYRRGAE
jgi:hypothetical protein